MLHALAFVLGFSVVFAFIGASVGLVGYVLQDVRRWINLVAGLLLVLFGVHATGMLRLATQRLLRAAETPGAPPSVRALGGAMLWLAETLYREKRLQYEPARRGLRASFGVGMAFAVGWTPCVGFVLGGILSAAFNSAEATGAMLLLLAYSLGLGLPFLVVAAILDRSAGVLRALQRKSTLASMISGLALIGFGALIALDLAPRLGAFVGRVPAVSDGFLAAGLGNSLDLAWTVPAFAAGVLSFLSPCVLPMVPIYLAHLAGVATAPTAGAEVGSAG